MAKVHVKVDDNVYVRCGKDRAVTGKVLKVLPATGRVVVQGVNMVSKHQKPTQSNTQGGIIQQENPISAANVMLICEKCKRPTKIGKKILANGSKVRYCKSCGEELDTVKTAKKA